MANKYTNFEVSSRSKDFLGTKKFKMGHVTWPCPLQGQEFYVTVTLCICDIPKKALAFSLPRNIANEKVTMFHLNASGLAHRCTAHDTAVATSARFYRYGLVL